MFQNVLKIKKGEKTIVQNEPKNWFEELMLSSTIATIIKRLKV